MQFDQMRRRELIMLLGGAAAAWPLAAPAQQPKMLRVGYSGILPLGAPHYVAFERRMAELGYQRGRNFAFEYIQSKGIEGYEQFYRELAARNVDTLLAAGNEPALRAARAARAAKPIVFTRSTSTQSRGATWRACPARATTQPASS
jgi:putative tryptophan/tyrosine transport system substrate-binding protein